MVYGLIAGEKGCTPPMQLSPYYIDVRDVALARQGFIPPSFLLYLRVRKEVPYLRRRVLVKRGGCVPRGGASGAQGPVTLPRRRGRVLAWNGIDDRRRAGEREVGVGDVRRVEDDCLGHGGQFLEAGEDLGVSWVLLYSTFPFPIFIPISYPTCVPLRVAF